MYRLLGYCAREEVPVAHLMGADGFAEFTGLAALHCDGWGKGWYEGSEPRLRKFDLDLHNASFVKRELLPWYQWALAAWLGHGNKKAVIGRDEFRALLVEVDLEDGVHDGKLAPPQRNEAPKPAPLCHCRFCKAENDVSNKFCSHCRRPLVRR